MENDKLFTQELTEIVNANSFSLIGDKKNGCAYNLYELCREIGIDSEWKDKALPKKLSISFKEENDSVSITSVSLKTVGCGSISMNRVEYKPFRSACKAVIERCYLSSKFLYGNLRRVVVLFGDGDIVYSVKDGILTVSNIPVNKELPVWSMDMQGRIEEEFSGVLEFIRKHVDPNARMVGYGVSRVDRSDYKKNDKDCGLFRKVTVSLNVYRVDASMAFYVGMDGSIMGLHGYSILENALDLCKSIQFSNNGGK